MVLIFVLGRAIKLPDGVDTKQAASIMLQGATVVYLTTDSYAVQKGDWVLVPAAAGGVGRLLCQLCLSKGANVIGQTSSPHKVNEIKSLGVEHVISGIETDEVVEQVQKITNGQGKMARFNELLCLQVSRSFMMGWERQLLNHPLKV